MENEKKANLGNMMFTKEELKRFIEESDGDVHNVGELCDFLDESFEEECEMEGVPEEKETEDKPEEGNPEDGLEKGKCINFTAYGSRLGAHEDNVASTLARIDAKFPQCVMTQGEGQEGKQEELPVCFQQNQRNEVRLIGSDGKTAGSLSTTFSAKQTNVIAHENHLHKEDKQEDAVKEQEEMQQKPNTLKDVVLKQRMIVRRLLPVECERLMGFPDNYTRIRWNGRPEEECPDSPRYKVCGNSMCVNVMRWIGERIQLVQEAIDAEKEAAEKAKSKADE